MTETYILDYIEGKPVCRVIRSRRKTTEVRIEGSGDVILRVPQRASEKQIRQVLEEKAQWISRKREEAIRKAQRAVPMTDGKQITVCGQTYAITVIEEDRKQAVVSAQDDKLVIRTACLKPDFIEDCVRSWCRKAARPIIYLKVEAYARRLGVTYGRVSIKEQKSRWGSCSSKGNLNFNWKLVLAPPEILDYVVVHELCHLKEMNHSPAFWELVEQIVPDYKEKRKWLKDNGSML